MRLGGRLVGWGRVPARRRLLAATPATPETPGSQRERGRGSGSYKPPALLEGKDGLEKDLGHQP